MAGTFIRIIAVIIALVFVAYAGICIWKKTFLPWHWFPQYVPSNKKPAVNCINNCLRGKCGTEAFNNCQVVDECARITGEGSCNATDFCKWATGACVPKDPKVSCLPATETCINENTDACSAENICPAKYWPHENKEVAKKE